MASFPSFPTFPSIDLSAFDLSKIDLSRIEVAGLDTDKVLGVLRDAAYVAIGFGVLTVQQVQVRRRELMTQLRQLGVGMEQVDDVVKQLEAARKQMRGLLVSAA